jgi:GAF domain/PilZ domain/Sel1 repeat
MSSLACPSVTITILFALSSHVEPGGWGKMECDLSMERPHAIVPAEITPENPGGSRERRQARRHKIVTPAYANRGGSSQGAALDLNEILNLSESGMCMQAASTLPVGHLLPLGIDLTRGGETIRTVGYVAWSEASGKTGIRFPEIAEGTRAQLQRWLAANGEVALPGEDWAAIEKEVECCGDDTEAALNVIGQHALRVTRASGAAIALIDPQDRETMICRARAGEVAPGMGARLETGTGFSGECVRSGATLKCDDSESDTRVDRESCRALRIRSIVACPVRREGKVIGILEVFSREAEAFGEGEVKGLERLAGMVERATEPAKVVEFPAAGDAASHFKDATLAAGEDSYARPRRRGRGIFFLLIAVVGIAAAVWVGARWMAGRRRVAIVAPVAASATVLPRETYIGADLRDVQSHADAGDAEAEYELGVRYASGIDVNQDYGQAMRWFLQAADQGSARAQGRVAWWMFLGRGAAQDYSKAYYWGLLAQAGGDESGRTMVVNSAPYLSPVQIAEEQRQAENWLHGHHIGKAGQ